MLNGLSPGRLVLFIKRPFPMPQISTENITKIFRVPTRAPVRAGAVAHRFRTKSEFSKAVDSISVFIESGESAAYYPTMLLLDKISPPPPISRLTPRTGLWRHPCRPYGYGDAA
jgi:hypothetical protein